MLFPTCGIQKESGAMTASIVVAILILVVISSRLIRSRQKEAHQLDSLIESLFLYPSERRNSK
jgi:hypothetical protein